MLVRGLVARTAGGEGAPHVVSACWVFPAVPLLLAAWKSRPGESGIPVFGDSSRGSGPSAASPYLGDLAQPLGFSEPQFSPL